MVTIRNLAGPLAVYHAMNKLHLLQCRQERTAVKIDELNAIASSALSEQYLIKFDLLATLEELRSELQDLRKEVNVLLEADKCVRTGIDTSLRKEYEL